MLFLPTKLPVVPGEMQASGEYEAELRYLFHSLLRTIYGGWRLI